MKRILLMGLLVAACDVIGPDDLGKGELRVSFAKDAVARSVSEVPDTGDFILSITDSKGGTVYSGKYASCPEVMEVPSGNYTVKVLSHEFRKPAFSSPQFGDEQSVKVPAGGVADVRLMCGQMNCGVKLNVSPDFLTAYPGGVLFLKSPEGKLMYGYSEKRYAYFLPGNVSLVLSDGGTDEVLITRSLQAREMLVLKVNVAQTPDEPDPDMHGAKVSVAIDTTRNWVTDTYEIGGGVQGSSPAEAMTVAQARASAGVEDVWISGYIVGGDLTSSSASFEAPFESRTNIVIGPKSTTSNRSSCLSVQLVAGDAREALNLVDNPSNLGRRILLKGNVVEAYYGMPGIKNITDFELR